MVRAEGGGRGRLHSTEVHVAEIAGYLIGAVGVAVGVWGLRRTLRQQRAAGLHTLIGDAGLQLLRMLVKFGPIHETKERRVGTALMTRAFFLGPFMVSSLAPENEWIRPTLYHLENEGLIEGSERGRWPQGPSEAWITERGRALVRLNEKRKIREHRIVTGAPWCVE